MRAFNTCAGMECACNQTLNAPTCNTCRLFTLQGWHQHACLQHVRMECAGNMQPRAGPSPCEEGACMRVLNMRVLSTRAHMGCDCNRCMQPHALSSPHLVRKAPGVVPIAPCSANPAVAPPRPAVRPCTCSIPTEGQPPARMVSTLSVVAVLGTVWPAAGKAGLQSGCNSPATALRWPASNCCCCCCRMLELLPYARCHVMLLALLLSGPR